MHKVAVCQLNEVAHAKGTPLYVRCCLLQEQHTWQSALPLAASAEGEAYGSHRALMHVQVSLPCAAVRWSCTSPWVQ